MIIKCAHDISADIEELVTEAKENGIAFADALIQVTLGGERIDVDDYAPEHIEDSIKATLSAKYDGDAITITLEDDEFMESDFCEETGKSYKFTSSDGVVCITDILEVEA